MIFLLLVATPLFTYGTALIEAGAADRGDSTLHSLLSTSINEEMRNRIFYNLGVAALNQSSWNDALSYFQQIDKEESTLAPFVKEGIQTALQNKNEKSLPPLPTLPTLLNLPDTTKQVDLILLHLTALPFEGGEKSPEYSALAARLDTLLEKKKEWWGSVIEKEEGTASKGCFQQHWEGVVQRLSEGTQLLEKAEDSFKAGAKPYATLYPLLKEALANLQTATNGLASEQEGGGQHPEQTERFQTLSEMFRKDATAPAPIPKDALW